MPYNLKDPEKIIETTLDQLVDNGQLKEKDKAKLEKVMADVFIEQKAPKEALNLTVNDVECMYSYAYNLFTHGKFLDAKIMMKFLMSLDPEDARYPLGCGAALQQLKDYEMAASYYLLAFHLDQEDPVPLYYMYECFKKLNDPYNALLMLENIVQRAGNKPEHAVLVERARRTRDTLKQELEDLNAQNKTTEGAA